MLKGIEMNYLAHLYLAERTGTSLIGSLMGDFARGRLRPGRFSPAIEQGIRLHRRVDTFTDAHPAVRASRGRLQPPFRRYGGILIDMFYDHYLARHWGQFHEQPLAAFARRVNALLDARAESLPQDLRRMARILREHELLLSYRDATGIERALRGISQRLSRPNPLPWGIRELNRSYAQLEADFFVFMPQLETFAYAESERVDCSTV